jgi:serine/threonine-protein kinase
MAITDGPGVGSAPGAGGASAGSAASASVSGTGGIATASASSPVAEAPSWKGRRVKRFKLIDEIGQGAMGRVFLAEDTLLRRHVALKLLPAKHKDGRPNHRTERLVLEARSAANLDHPNVVTIHEIDQSAGVHYIAMELVEGGNLEKLVQLSGPMEIERACLLIADAAEALAHAHERGVIHRDIKPANLLLTRSGRCKVTDFGLALFEDAQDEAIRVKCVGTPNFIPPEVAMGQGAAEWSDIYSLGCTIFFLLTGRPPYPGTSARDVMRAHVSQPLPDLRRFRPDLPERLVAAIEQACAKNPRDRFPSADHFAKVLRTFTIPTASSSAASMNPISGGSTGGSRGGSRGSDSDHLAPVSAAQLAAILPAVESGGEKSTFYMPGALLWTAIGTTAAVILIGLGVTMARRGSAPAEASKTAQAAPPSAPAAPGAPAPPAPAATIANVLAAPAAAVSPPTPPAPPASPKIQDSDNAIANGSIEEGDIADGKIVGWFIAERCAPNVRTLSEAGNRFMRLTNADPTTTVHADQKIELDSSWRRVVVSARIRASDFTPGRASSGLTYAFQNAQGKSIGKFQPPLLIRENSSWEQRTETVDVPAGARKLYLQCVVAYAKGTIDFDDVTVVGQK